MPERPRRWLVLLPLLLAALCATRVPALALPGGLLLLGWLPGRVLLRAIRLDRRYCRGGRFLLSLGLSLAVMPVLLNPIWHSTNQGWQLLLFSASLLTVAMLLMGRFAQNAEITDEDGTNGGRPGEIQGSAAAPLLLFVSMRARVLATTLFGLIALGTIGSYWPGDIGRGPTPAIIHDYIKHHAILFSMERGPLPLGNPFFADQATGPTYYYHFFYLIPATLRSFVPGLSIGLAFGLCAALVGIAIAGLLTILAAELAASKKTHPQMMQMSQMEAGKAGAASVEGVALLALLLATAVGGLDIVPVLLLHLKTVTLDAWADTLVRIHNLVTQMVWTPQNMQGLLVGLVGAWLLGRKSWWRGWLVLGPILAANLIGSSVWIAFALLPALVIFVVSDLRVEVARRLGAAALTGLMMLACAWPSLAGYREMSQRFGKSLTTEWSHQAHALLGHYVAPGPLANLLDLPWLLLIELGALIVFPLLLPGGVWRLAWRDRGVRLLLIASALALIGFVTLRSHYTYNDFGQRVILVVLATGVVLAGQIVSGSSASTTPIWNPLGWRFCEMLSPGRQRLAKFVFVPLLLLGLPVGLYQVPLAAVRRHLPLTGPGSFLVPGDVRQALREAGGLHFMRDHLPANAVVQAHWGDGRVDLLQLIGHPLGVTVLQEDTMVFQPVQRAGHEQALADLTSALQSAGATPGAVRDTLAKHHITHVFVGEIERATWSGAAVLDDARFFRVDYRDAATAVYEVLPEQ